MNFYLKREKKNQEIVELIQKEAEKYGFILDDLNPEIVFSIGGDGTFLRAVHQYIDDIDDVTFIGINTGSLGFFYEFNKEQIPSIMKSISDRTYPLKKYPLLKGIAEYKKETVNIYALNEIRIENPFHTLISDVFINDEKLETYRGNGLVVSSSLGSSAYNKSLGGSLIESDLCALELTEIAPLQNNIYRSLGSSLVVGGEKTISFTGNLGKAVVGFDHLNVERDDELLSVSISYSKKQVKIIQSNNHSYIQKIRKSFVL